MASALARRAHLYGRNLFFDWRCCLGEQHSCFKQAAGCITGETPAGYGTIMLPRKRPSRMLWMVQHVFAEIALAAIGAGVGVVALNVAVLAAGDIFRRAGL